MHFLQVEISFKPVESVISLCVRDLAPKCAFKCTLWIGPPYELCCSEL